MLALTLALALVSCAHAACDACIEGVCHSRQSLLKGFLVTDQLAIDHTHNVLYTQFNDDQNVALFLDHQEIRQLHMKRTSGMAVDQQTHILYLGSKETAKTFYKYHLESNTTEAVITEYDNMKPDIMFYWGSGDNGALHFVSYNRKQLQLYNNTIQVDRVRQYKQLEKYTISDFIFDKDSTIYFVSNDTVYAYDYDYVNWATQPREIASKNYVLSADRYGDVYFGDLSEKVIYTRDKTKGNLEIYASYKSGAVEDFVFDRDNNIVFRDADGSVGRWVPAPRRRRNARGAESCRRTKTTSSGKYRSTKHATNK